MAKEQINMEKTNVMRTLDRLKIPYQAYCYVDSGAVSGPYTETEFAAACAEQGVDAANIGWQAQKDWNKVYDR